MGSVTAFPLTTVAGSALPAATTLAAADIVQVTQSGITSKSTVGAFALVPTDLAVTVVGKGLRVKEGTNGKQGASTLVAGTVTVANNTVTATSRIFLTAQALGTVTVPKTLAVTARAVGTSFTITSADATDTSTVAWQMFEPA